MSLAPKLFKTDIAEYVSSEYTGTNTSGCFPLGDKILILPDKAAEVVRGIHMPQDVVHRHTLAAEAGVVVAVGDGAFKWNSDKTTPYEGRRPVPGDRVTMERYSGQVICGDDKQMYRVMDSACIGTIITSDVPRSG